MTNRFLITIAENKKNAKKLVRKCINKPTDRKGQTGQKISTKFLLFLLEINEVKCYDNVVSKRK